MLKPGLEARDVELIKIFGAYWIARSQASRSDAVLRTAMPGGDSYGWRGVSNHEVAQHANRLPR